jgi:GTPase Era involved in 16S rRNA processing
MNSSKKIYVVSIFGRQSSGKSYLLNRIFGTRFAVAASRCTDGIWASLAFL